MGSRNLIPTCCFFWGLQLVPLVWILLAFFLQSSLQVGRTWCLLAQGFPTSMWDYKLQKGRPTSQPTWTWVRCVFFCWPRAAAMAVWSSASQDFWRRVVGVVTAGRVPWEQHGWSPPGEDPAEDAPPGLGGGRPMVGTPKAICGCGADGEMGAVDAEVEMCGTWKKRFSI